MGPCPSTVSPLMTPLASCFYSWTWLEPQFNLPPLGAQSDSLTVSGWSGGGSAAGNFQVVFSDYIKGVGLIESGPFGDSFNFGMEPDSNESATASINLANKLYGEGRIDNPENLSGHPVYIFSGGPTDKGYPYAYQMAQRQFFENYGANV